MHELVHVSAGLRAAGGGTAHLGRLTGRVLRAFSARRGLRFRGFELPSSDGGVASDGYVHCGGSRTLLTCILLCDLIRSRGRAFYFFDHIGPARSLAPVPGRLLPRYAVQLHGIEIWRDLSWDRRRVLANATLLVANSSYTAERFRGAAAPDERLRVVLLGTDPPGDLGAGDSAILESAGAGFALIVGRMAAGERYKGHDLLLEIWPEVQRRLPGARLVVAGSGSDLDRLRQRAAELGVANDVCFTGRVDAATLAELYRRSALFVMPSRDEGFGFVFAEAMAAGKPCVALAGTAAAEIVVDGETGRLVPPDEPRVLTAALVALLEDGALATRLGNAGRRRWESEFTRERFEARLLPVVDELLSGAEALV